jgi:hypothetical protein
MTLDDLLELDKKQINDLFAKSPPGPVPEGEGEGRAIVAPGTKIDDTIAGLIRIFAWKGKVFKRDEDDPERGTLRNEILPFGIKAIEAKVYKADSWFDDKPAIILDYSKTSLLAREIRDEIREVEPGLYLGKVFWGDRDPDEKALLHFALDFRGHG